MKTKIHTHSHIQHYIHTSLKTKIHKKKKIKQKQNCNEIIKKRIVGNLSKIMKENHKEYI